MSSCSICLDANYGRTLRTPCAHSFHFGCLRQALRHNQRCPLCRQEISTAWMITRRLRLTSRTYWSRVERGFGPMPIIGPLLPFQQRRFDYYNGEISQEPAWWTRPWINDRLIELRIRFNIASDIELTSQDLRLCEENGALGIRPEWAPPTWVHYL